MPAHTRRRVLGAALTVGLAPLLLTAGALAPPAAAETEIEPYARIPLESYRNRPLAGDS
jgi:hypothetical protein